LLERGEEGKVICLLREKNAPLFASPQQGEKKRIIRGERKKKGKRSRHINAKNIHALEKREKKEA